MACADEQSINMLTAGLASSVFSVLSITQTLSREAGLRKLVSLCVCVNVWIVCMHDSVPVKENVCMHDSGCYSC